MIRNTQKKNTQAVSQNETLKRNKARLCGIIVEAPVFDHKNETYDVEYYLFKVSVPRLSGAEDIIPCKVSKNDFDLNALKVGEKVMIKGQFKSHNVEENERRRLKLFVYCSDIIVLNDEEFSALNSKNNNLITLYGYVCKSPDYRKTPFGKEITDLFLAVNRSFNRTDYIPCIIWGNNAKYASRFKVGDFIILEGRIQSRNYDKKDEAGNVISTHTAYEISAQKIFKTGITTRKNRD